jgi:sugar-specific transcriptional regulator TrmB
MLAFKQKICYPIVVMKTDNKEIINGLERYGFTENESLIYIYLLKKLEATAFEVAKETGIPRTTVYATLELLKKQRIISQFRKNNVAFFAPESPNRLLSQLKEKEEIVASIMPQIRAVASKKMDAPTVKLYVGIDGLKTGLIEILETIKDHKLKQILATSQPDMLEYLPKYFPNWLKQREDMGVFTKLILPQSVGEYLKSNELREVRYLPDKFPFTSSVTICADKMIFFSTQNDEPHCVSVESAAITEMFTQFFLFTWEMLGKRG